MTTSNQFATIKLLDAVANVLAAERCNAEATLGRELIDPVRFSVNCMTDGLGHALNIEHELVV